MNWSEVKDKIDKEAKRIRLTPPDEILKLFKYQITDISAGCYDQTFTTMVFCEGDCRAMVMYNVNKFSVIIDDPSFTLDQLKILARYYLPIGSEFLGYRGLKKIWEFTRDVLGALDTVNTKDEFRELMNSLNFYVSVIHGWIHHYFPWYLGELFPRRKTDDVKKMAELIG